MGQQSDSTYSFEASSRRPNRKKPVEIFVSAGSFSRPYYSFQDKKGRAIDQLELNTNKKYRFRRSNNATTHPFYISDQGFNQSGTNKIKIRGDGRPDNGIINSEAFTLSFKKKHRRELAKSGKLFFYCTSHASMIEEILINAGRRKQQNRRPTGFSRTFKTTIMAESLDQSIPTFKLEPSLLASTALSEQNHSAFDLTDTIKTVPADF
jgi:hypothetical protein